MRRAILLLSVAVLALSACAGNSAGGNRSDSPAAVTSSPAASGTLGPSPSLPAGVGGHYQGPDVAFDIPKDWHEFNLDVSMHFYAAYGPVSGGDDDYVMIAPVPAEAKGIPPEEILASPPMRTGPVESVNVNGMPGYSAPVALTSPNGQALEGQETLVRGQRGDYLVACQYGKHMKELVPIGCQMLKDTLVEVPPPTITDPSGCTDAELALLQSVRMPDGTDPGKPKVMLSGDGRACDLAVVPSQPKTGYQGDLVGYFSSRLKSAGWHVPKAKVDRMSGPFQVWQLLAIRDWDIYMVEIYIDVKGAVVAKGAAQNLFITVSDG